MAERACVCGEPVTNPNPCEYVCGDCKRWESVPTSWKPRSEKEWEDVDASGGSYRYPWKG
jgi:hypothetical protein